MTWPATKSGSTASLALSNLRIPISRCSTRCAEFLEPDCRWNGLLNAISSYINGVELDGLSVLDHSRYRDSGVNWRVINGYGALIEAASSGLAIEFGLCPSIRLVSVLGESPQVPYPTVLSELSSSSVILRPL